MSESVIQNINIKDFLELTCELIAEDLKIQNHFQSMSKAGLEHKSIQLKLRSIIFRFMYIKNENILIEAEEWYYEKVKDSFTKNVIKDKFILMELSTEIMSGLIKFQKKSIQNI